MALKDKLQEYALLAEIISAIAIVASLIFVGAQIQQNNQLSRSQAVNTALDTRIRRNDIIFNNPEVANIVAKNINGETLTIGEIEVVRASYVSGLLGWQRDYNLFKEGILMDKDIQTNISTIKSVFGQSDRAIQFYDFWQEWSAVNSTPEFKNFIESCVLNDCSEIP